MGLLNCWLWICVGIKNIGLDNYKNMLILRLGRWNHVLIIVFCSVKKVLGPRVNKSAWNWWCAKFLWVSWNSNCYRVLYLIFFFLFFSYYFFFISSANYILHDLSKKIKDQKMRQKQDKKQITTEKFPDSPIWFFLHNKSKKVPN